MPKYDETDSFSFGDEETDEIKLKEGMEGTPRKEWQVTKQLAIDVVKPDSEVHDRVLNYMMDRYQMSYSEMSAFHPRWEIAAKKAQAYVKLSDYEQELKRLNDNCEPTRALPIIVPHTYATISTIVTYLLQTFCGRNPIFPVTSIKNEYFQKALNMEKLIQYNCQKNRIAKKLYQFFGDGQTFGVGVLINQWEIQKNYRTRLQESGLEGILPIKVRSKVTTYEGNVVTNIAPEHFYPDPRVPMSEVNKRGEFVFWRTVMGRQDIKKGEIDGIYKYVDEIGQWSYSPYLGDANIISRNLLSGGNGANAIGEGTQVRSSFVKILEGTVELIPAELGIGEHDYPCKYLVTIANDRQIIRLEPFEHDHDMHPVVVIEPYTLGYGFGQPGISEYVNPLQDLMTWFMTSHVDNVRSSLNNMLIYDPMLIEEQDILDTRAGGRIRMKSNMFGRDIRSAVFQIPIQDITRSHVPDMQTIKQMADSISAVNDNLRGVPQSGGRKTATEVRVGGQSAGSRLATHAQLISAQMIDLPEMMSLNLQQFLSDEFVYEVLSESGRDPAIISSSDIVGDFNYTVHDGSLPIDKYAIFQSWIEFFQTLITIPGIGEQYRVDELIQYIASLGGMEKLNTFRKTDAQVMPDDQALEMQDKGQTVPAPVNNLLGMM